MKQGFGEVTEFCLTEMSFLSLGLGHEYIYKLKVTISYSPLSHGGHIGYDVCTLGMKSRRCVSNLRFAAIDRFHCHATKK